MSSLIKLTFKSITEQAKIDYCECENIICTVELKQGDTEVIWTNLPSKARIVELWLPQNIGMTLQSVYVNKDAFVESIQDNRPIWITYGSSITQCVAASSPALTWPSIVARATNYRLVNLGFSGNCQLEPIYATNREWELNKLELTVSSIRDEVAAVAEMYQQRGDTYLYYRDGREWIGEADAELLSDGLHPNAEGYLLMGERFQKML